MLAAPVVLRVRLFALNEPSEATSIPAEPAIIFTVLAVTLFAAFKPLLACVLVKVKVPAETLLTVTRLFALSVKFATPAPALAVRLVAEVEATLIPTALELAMSSGVDRPVTVSVDATFPFRADSVIEMLAL